MIVMIIITIILLLDMNIIEAKRSKHSKRGGSHRSHKSKGAKIRRRNAELPCKKGAEGEVDAVFGRISGYGNVSRPFPTDQQELSDYCKGQFSDIRLIESYAKRCQHGLPKQYFNILVYTIKGSMSRICKKNSKKARQFLSASGCIRRASHHFDQCHRNLIERLHRIKFSDDKKKIPYTCCEYYTLRKCFQDGGRNEAKCSDKEMETVEELIESTSSNALNFFCGEYAEDSDKCEKLGPLAEAPSKSGRKSRPKYLRSISLTVAEIFDTFPEISTRT
ncbi:hypothetical protein BLA29_006110 [Euroglyphus maynei]|uniref:Group XIIA secretory phospholipase A2-like protein n=1 Tax=Euroglyphus maynei TaxID=6958 RepID=A0A1Y3BQN6_EURMA|nr:hypothetical protein BLA29_006110 [Euroglyphus maynei]